MGIALIVVVVFVYCLSLEVAMFAQRLPVLVAEAGVYELVKFNDCYFELRMFCDAKRCRRVAYENREEALEVLELLAAPCKVRICKPHERAANY